MLKSYEEMRQVDVTPYCEEREGMLYLNWAKCIDLLRENGAKKVYWEPVPDEKTGSSLRMTEKEFEDSKGNKTGAMRPESELLSTTTNITCSPRS